MAQSHDGRVAIVTGAGRGIGRAMALGLASAGAQVVTVDVDAPVLEELRAAAPDAATRDRLHATQADVTREDNVHDIVAKTAARFGRLDILVNNAGLNLETVGAGAPLSWELTPAQFRRILEVNTVAPFLFAREAVRPMMAQKWGRIIGVTTSLDTMWRKGMIPYGGSKAAHEAYVAALAEELAGTGVTANVLVPGGPVNTRMTASFGAKQSALIQPGVMVEPLLRLTSPEADGITGRRFIAALWDRNLSLAAAAEKCGAPAAWPQLGRQTIFPSDH